MKIVFLLLMLFSLDSFTQIKEYIGIPVAATFAVDIEENSYCSYKNYKVYKDSIVKNPVLKMIKDRYLKEGFFKKVSKTSSGIEVLPYIKFNRVFTCKYKDKDVVVVNYTTSVDKTNKTYVSDPTTSIANALEQLVKIKTLSFWRFYTDGFEVPGDLFHNLRYSIRDGSGRININRLQKFVNENYSVLKQYNIVE